jgi:hypothetical protein
VKFHDALGIRMLHGEHLHPDAHAGAELLAHLAREARGK